MIVRIEPPELQIFISRDRVSPAITLPNDMSRLLLIQFPAPSEIDKVATGPEAAVPVKSTVADPELVQNVSKEPQVPAVCSEKVTIIVVDCPGCSWFVVAGKFVAVNPLPTVDVVWTDTLL